MKKNAKTLSEGMINALLLKLFLVTGSVVRISKNAFIFYIYYLIVWFATLSFMIYRTKLTHMNEYDKHTPSMTL